MKRVLNLLALCCLSCPFSAAPQEAAPAAAAVAERQEAEERYKRLSADGESLITANAALQKKISRIGDELKNLREEQASRGAAHATAKEDLKRLAKKIQEVDEKREADKQLILEELSKIGKLLSSGAASPRAT